VGLRVAVELRIDGLDGSTITHAFSHDMTFNAEPVDSEREIALALASIDEQYEVNRARLERRLNDWATTVQRLLDEGKPDAP
jgi:hypothetical protein